MYDTVITLLSESGVAYDEHGNEYTHYVDREVYAIPRGVYRAEFYNAAQLGLHPSMSFRITNVEDYEGEKLLIHDGKAYSVIRADWTAQRDAIDLVCEERIGNGTIGDPFMKYFDMTTENGAVITDETGEPIQAGILVRA